MKLTNDKPRDSDLQSNSNDTRKPGRLKKSVNPVKMSYSIVGVVGLIASAALCFYIYKTQIIAEQTQQLNAFAQQKTDEMAASLQQYFNQLTQKTSALASDELFRNAFANDNKVELENLKRRMQLQLPHVLAVQVFKLGEADVDTKKFPPTRFSELSLIKVAERGVIPIPEAVNIDNKWLLHIIVPIAARQSEGVAENNSQVDGTLWISTSIEGLSKHLLENSQPQGNVSLGALRLYQKFGASKRKLIVEQGEGALDVSHSNKIGDSQWEIEFTASENLIAQIHSSNTIVYIVMAIAVFVIVALSSISGLFIGRLFQSRNERKMLEEQMQNANRASPKPSINKDSEEFDSNYINTGIMDIEINEEDERLAGISDDEDDNGRANQSNLELDDDIFDMDQASNPELEAQLPKAVFRAYDIRGKAQDEISKEFALSLGKALGTEINDSSGDTLVVARDARTHSPELTEWLIRGILSSGCHVLNIGTVPTPLMYFALSTMEELSSGVMVTASHNAAEYNGFKIVMNGITRSGDDIQALRKRMLTRQFDEGKGNEHHHDIVSNYIDTIFSDVALAGEINVVIDAGNGVAGKVAPRLFEELGCRVTPLYCDLDGTFPHHDPDPSVEENLKDLISKVKDVGAEIGIALDGDGDRLTVVSPTGNIYFADRLLMLFAKDIISRHPGSDVVFDVKSSRHLNACITNYGGRPVMWKTGHSLMKEKMRETNAVIGAEYSGHIFIKDRWFGFDDGMYAAARLLEVLSLQGENIDEAFAEFPSSVNTPEIRVAIDEDKKFGLIEKLKQDGDFGEGRLTLIDGVRADFAYGWGLVRASNTAAELTMRFEADSEQAIHKLKSLFVRELRKLDSSLEVNWNQ